jgi:hypothetical protein
MTMRTFINTCQRGLASQRVAAPRALVLTVWLLTSACPLASCLVHEPNSPVSWQGCADPRTEFDALQMLAAKMLDSTDVVGRKRIRISGRILTYDLEAAPYSLLVSHPDRLTVPIELLIRAAVLRRDLDELSPKQAFHAGPLTELQAITKKMVNDACQSANEDEWHTKQESSEEEVRAKLAIIKKGLEDYALEMHLEVAKARGAIQGYKVRILKDPPSGHVRLMRYLDYLICLKPPGQPADNECLDKAWETVLSDSKTLIGKYRFRAEWPESLDPPQEENTVVTEVTKELIFTCSCHMKASPATAKVPSKVK